MSERPAGRRRLLMIVATITMAALVALVMLVVVDVYLHGKYEKSAGFNIWGYRGPVAPRKHAGEYRVAFLGGSTAFGYGVDWAEAIPAQLERKLADRHAGPYATFSVVNLAYNNEGAYSLRFTLQDYLSLRYDLVCLYEGYNDVLGENTSVFRRESPIFRLTGYLPISPIILKEKAALMTAGNINSMYVFKGKTVFHPTIAARTTAEALRATAAVEESLERQLARMTPTVSASAGRDLASTGCLKDWQPYCHSMLVAINYALQQGAQVMVITQPYELGPYMGTRHREQQSELRSMIERRFGGDRRVRYENLGPTVDLGDIRLSYDHMHLTVAGNEQIAAALVQPVLDLAANRSTEVRQSHE
jgi:hypothetical protein